MWENLNIALKSLNGIILLIIYLRSTTGLTDTIINELSGSFIESGILSASSRIEQLTPINFEHFRSQTCSGDVSYGS